MDRFKLSIKAGVSCFEEQFQRELWQVSVLKHSQGLRKLYRLLQLFLIDIANELVSQGMNFRKVPSSAVH